VNLTGGATDTLASADSVAGFHITVPAPDGDHIVVNVSGGLELGRWRLAAVELSGRLWKWYDTGGHQDWLAPLLWKPDGWIYFLTAGSEVYRVPDEGGTAGHVVRLPEPCSVWQTALDAEARRLVCTVSNTEPDIWLADNFDPEKD
jgi:hypothetical protein